MAKISREEAVFETTEEYIRQRQITVAQYIDTRLLLELCGAIEKTLGARVGMRW